MEVTALCIRLSVNVLLLLTVQTRNSRCVHKADAAFLHTDPNRLQFFEYESLWLNCAGFQGSTEWRVMKKIPSNASRWETSTGSLTIKPAFVSHSGQYWCETRDGERSNTVNIHVTGGDVILESPALPAMEQQTVTLRCRTKEKSSNTPADFFKDDHFTETGYTGEMTMHNVSKSDEGHYKCTISGAGESAESWLTVRARVTPTPQDGPETPTHPPYPGFILLSILLPLVILVVAVLLLLLGLHHCRKHREECFSSVTLTTESEPVYAVASAPDSQIPIYAHVRRH